MFEINERQDWLLAGPAVGAGGARLCGNLPARGGVGWRKSVWRRECENAGPRVCGLLGGGPCGGRKKTFLRNIFAATPFAALLIFPASA